MIKTLFFVGALFFPTLICANNWEYKKITDEFTDSAIHWSKVAGNVKGSSLTVRCDDNRVLDVVFSVGQYIGKGENYKIRYRFDAEKPMFGIWRVSTEGTEVFASTDKKRKIAQQLMSAKKLIIEITDYNGTAWKAKFSLNGSSKPISKTLRACPQTNKENSFVGIQKELVKHIAKLGPANTICHITRIC